MAKEKTNKRKAEEPKQEKQDVAEVGAMCNDKRCPIHGNLKTRGRNFMGHVIRIKDKRVVIEFERFVYIKKYERYEKRKTRIHAHLPDCMASNVKVGDYVLVAECRPLSKIMHHVLISNKEEEKK